MYYPSKAREIAMQNNQPFHLAAWFRRGSSIVFSTNSGRCSTKFKRTYRDGSVGYHLHAEMALLNKVPVGSISEVHVIRFTKNGSITMAKPCEHCQKYLKEYGIKKVHYTNWDGLWSRMRL